MSWKGLESKKDLDEFFKNLFNEDKSNKRRQLFFYKINADKIEKPRVRRKVKKLLDIFDDFLKEFEKNV